MNGPQSTLCVANVVLDLIDEAFTKCVPRRRGNEKTRGNGWRYSHVSNRQRQQPDRGHKITAASSRVFRTMQNASPAAGADSVSQRREVIGHERGEQTVTMDGNPIMLKGRCSRPAPATRRAAPAAASFQHPPREGRVHALFVRRQGGGKNVPRLSTSWC